MSRRIAAPIFALATGGILVLAGVLTMAPLRSADAGTVYCFPKNLDPQILLSPKDGDYHPDWAPPSGVGTGWSLTRLGRHGGYLKGILNTSRGNPTTGVIYVVAAEWNCG
jgi:hypothetical protein